MIREASVRESDELVWFKSSYSDSGNPSDCVEAAASPGAVHIRDSKNIAGPRLAVPSSAWAAFVSYASDH
ncbi:DUF397 domain-containing protein [Streptomyces albipurpureus]|uniref:DUF397 domain-containing protein n=1 Tax=Streptomyces albipurpureus TaxID=2897419 RepID=A0ABT0V143_9ACTN|nr:DUF397 domain-containing protein [Streptomyces sp. CWNU-1]MCM2393116.1 DUF397 domain-containing protein [Streptomyces sp. CWNU-1]